MCCTNKRALPCLTCVEAVIGSKGLKVWETGSCLDVDFITNIRKCRPFPSLFHTAQVSLNKPLNPQQFTHVWTWSTVFPKKNPLYSFACDLWDLENRLVRNTSVCCPRKDTQMWRTTNTSLLQNAARCVTLCHFSSFDVTLYKDTFQITREVTPRVSNAHVQKYANRFDFDMRKQEHVVAWIFAEAEEKKKENSLCIKMVTIPTVFKRSALLTCKTVAWIIEQWAWQRENNLSHEPLMQDDTVSAGRGGIIKGC